MDNIIVMKLTKEQYKQLQEMVNNGWSTDFEKAIYFNCFGMGEVEQKTSIAEWVKMRHVVDFNLV